MKVRRALQNSRMLSSDVSAAYDPMYAEAFEKRSAAFFGKGLVFNKFTGARGKSGSNDANAEYLAEIRRAMNTEDISYQSLNLERSTLEAVEQLLILWQIMAWKLSTVVWQS